MNIKMVEWCGSLLGLLGAGLLALNIPVSGYGFVAFLVSNMCWLYVGIRTGSAPMVLMQIGFTGTSLLGLWRWLL